VSGFKFSPNQKSIASLVDLPDVGDLVDDRARDIAHAAQMTAREVGRMPWKVRARYKPSEVTDDEDAVIAYYPGERTRGLKSPLGQRRRRAAVIAFHAMGTGRKIGRTAIRQATIAATGAVTTPKRSG
jgi:hypothetical protein